MKHWIFTFLLIFSTTIYAQNNPKREFRGVWVATVNNIDWPSKPGISVQQQKEEADRIIESQSKNGMNAIIFQIRPASDAFYKSSLEPWSRYLTGTPGKAPDPVYDPLQYWIEACHKHGIELHAWMNPFRVAQSAQELLAGNHVAFQHPEWIVNYGDKLYFDPGQPGPRDFVVQVVKDVVSRYDIDGIHFDDYFYPYPVDGKDFPDAASFTTYNPRQISDIGDWRRDNVNQIIEQLHQTIQQTKPWVKFGISPFGVWRNQKNDPRGSATNAGTTNYESLYADILLWLQKGWIDYVTPQLYWQIGHPSVDFKTLCDWWADHSYGKDVYIGHAVYKVDPNSNIPEWRSTAQLNTQIEYLRKNRAIGGSVYFRSGIFSQYPDFERDLQQYYYKYPALPPAMSWLDNRAPETPEKLKCKRKEISWQTAKKSAPGDMPTRFIIYRNKKGEPFNPNDPRFIYAYTFKPAFELTGVKKKKREQYEIRVSAVDRSNNESPVSKPEKIKM